MDERERKARKSFFHLECLYTSEWFYFQLSITFSANKIVTRQCYTEKKNWVWHPSFSIGKATNLKNKKSSENKGGNHSKNNLLCYACRCLTGCPPRDIPKVVSFGWGDAEIRNLKVQGTQGF
jgi:hypothetical protein